jgi:hypothetical protein
MNSQRLQSIPSKTLQLFLIVIMLFSCVLPTFGKDNVSEKKKEKSLLVSILGIGLVAGGSVGSYYNYTKARDHYKVYKRSAFTENTTELHKDVRQHDAGCILSALAAGLGAVIIVVPF